MRLHRGGMIEARADEVRLQLRHMRPDVTGVRPDVGQVRPDVMQMRTETHSVPRS
ncbi:MAG: hypothetical protein WB974_07065 [Acidobacteriaceae bacterium]